MNAESGEDKFVGFELRKENDAQGRQRLGDEGVVTRRWVIKNYEAREYLPKALPHLLRPAGVSLTEMSDQHSILLNVFLF
jgi:hypothetical protein